MKPSASGTFGGIQIIYKYLRIDHHIPTGDPPARDASLTPMHAALIRGQQWYPDALHVVGFHRSFEFLNHGLK